MQEQRIKILQTVLTKSLNFCCSSFPIICRIKAGGSVSMKPSEDEKNITPYTLSSNTFLLVTNILTTGFNALKMRLIHVSICCVH